jgi:NAD(P)-dependent dehydrogenase (short-subunit alcohol dehydrogenase family)
MTGMDPMNQSNMLGGTRCSEPQRRASSSIDGQKGFAKLVPQCAAKAAVIGFTRALAKECWQDGIAVTAICPAEVDKSVAWGSEPKERPGAPSVKLLPADVARAAVFLASPEAEAVTGVTLDVYGIGFLAS